MAQVKRTATFQSGNSAAVRLLGPCRLPSGTHVRQWREGNRVIVEILQEAWPEMAQAVAGAYTQPLPRPSDP